MKNIKLFIYGFFLLFLASCGYNKLVEFDERADKHWYQIEDAYNRQSDLVPMLIKQFDKANEGDVKALSKARKSVADLSISKDEIEMSTIKKYIDRQQSFTEPLDNILRDLYNSIEKLPQGDNKRQELKTLATQIIGSHNRVAIACEKYNKVVDDYNEYQGGITQKATAGSMGFHHKEKLDINLFERKIPDFNALK